MVFVIKTKKNPVGKEVSFFEFCGFVMKKENYMIDCQIGMIDKKLIVILFFDFNIDEGV